MAETSPAMTPNERFNMTGNRCSGEKSFVCKDFFRRCSASKCADPEMQALRDVVALLADRVRVVDAQRAER
jgi:hypothetical protein